MAAEKRGAAPRPVRPIPDPEKPEVLLEREERGRLPAAIVAALCGVLSFVGFILLQLGGKSDRKGNSDRTKLLDYHDHTTEILAGSVLLAISALLAGYTLLFLYNATKGRRPQTLNAARVTAIAGPIVLAISQVGLQLTLAPKASDYVNDFPEAGKAATAAAKTALDDSTLQVFATTALAGQLALGFAFVIISLNAMRAGLLTRFVGILGVLLGVLMVLPLLPSPVVTSFWMLAVAAVIFGRSPRGVPPAWRTGKAEPWPSQQELREQAQAAKARERGEEPPEPAPAAEPVAADGPAAAAKPAPQKRKKKRRR